MLLAIDIGNTNIVYGIHDGESWMHHWRVRSVRDMMPDEYGVMLRAFMSEISLKLDMLDSIVVASVVPPLTGKFDELFHRTVSLKPLIINSQVNSGLTFRVDNPTEVGADLIADAVAAYALLQDSCIVVDFGTATTFTAVSKVKEFLGVAIAPGVGLAASALAGGTAQLPQIRLEVPTEPIGRNTIHAIQSGILLGYRSLVEGMTEQFRISMGTNAKVVATGGLSRIIAPLTNVFDVIDPWLTLDGIRIIGERNQL